MTIEQLLEVQPVKEFQVDGKLFLEEANSVDQTVLLESIKKMPYIDFLYTYYWICVSNIVKERDGHRCKMCSSREKLRTHHSTYVNHGAEHKHLNDLVCVCSVCHDIFHRRSKNKLPSNKSHKKKGGRKEPVIPQSYYEPWAPSTRLLTKGDWDSCRKRLQRIGVSKSQLSQVRYYDRIRIVESNCNWLPDDLERSVKWKRIVPTSGYGPWQIGKQQSIPETPIQSPL